MIGPGPYLSVYLDLAPGPARATAPMRLGEALRSLESRRDVTAAQLDAARLALDRVEPHDAMAAALVRADGRSIVASFPEPPRRDVIEVGWLPRVGPMLTAEQAMVHHVVAIVEDLDLQLLTVPRHGASGHETYRATDPLTIAPVIQHAVRVSNTRLLFVVAPEPQLRALHDQVRGAIPLSTKLHAIPLDGGESAVVQEIVTGLATHAAERTVELLRLWRFHAVHGEAVTGFAETTEAINANAVALVLLGDDADDNSELPISPSSSPVPIALPMPPAPTGETATDGSLAGHATARSSDVIIRGVLALDCPLHIVPDVSSTLTDGIGAILAERTDRAALAELLEQ